MSLQDVFAVTFIGKPLKAKEHLLPLSPSITINHTVITSLTISSIILINLGKLLQSCRDVCSLIMVATKVELPNGKSDANGNDLN